MGLENTGVVIDEKGFITVDAQRRTAEPTIYAVGDVAGQPMLAHKATYEGKVAAEAIAGMKTIYDPKAIPGVVFTDPEIAWCGMTEAEAKTAGREVTVTSFPWAASGRATTLGRSDGVTRLVLDEENLFRVRCPEERTHPSITILRNRAVVVLPQRPNPHVQHALVRRQIGEPQTVRGDAWLGPIRVSE